MSSQPLERSEFADPDQLPPEMHAILIGALDQMAGDPAIQRVRAVAWDALDARPGHRVLDVGCGAGEVARQLAARVAPDGDVVAVDISAVTVAIAAGRHDGGRVRYAVGDVAALDFPDGTFDRVRTERVLQHVADPDGAVAELARVTRPGGRVCLIDTDWESIAVDGLPDEVVVPVREAAFTRVRMHHASMGRTLRRRLVRAGLADARCEPVTLWFTDPESASAVIPLFNPAIPPEAGMMPAELRDPWFAALDAAAARDEFLAVLTIWVASATKPAP